MSCSFYRDRFYSINCNFFLAIKIHGKHLRAIKKFVEFKIGMVEARNNKREKFIFVKVKVKLTSLSVVWRLVDPIKLI